MIESNIKAVTVQFGQVGTSISYENNELKVEITPDFALKTIEDCKNLIKALTLAVDFVEREVHRTCTCECHCTEEHDECEEEFHVGPCYIE